MGGMVQFAVRRGGVAGGDAGDGGGVETEEVVEPFFDGVAGGVSGKVRTILGGCGKIWGVNFFFFGG
jgi:hypothetical protein